MPEHPELTPPTRGDAPPTRREASPTRQDPSRSVVADEAGAERGRSWWARMRSWWVPTPAELVGLALLLLGALAASILWWYPSVTGPGGARAPEQVPAQAPGAALEAVPEDAPDAVMAGDDPGAPARLDAPDAGGLQPPAPVGGAGPTGRVTVHVTGAVATAGLLTLPSGARVGDAVAATGGATADADLERINLARPLVDGEHVHVPRLGEEPPVAMDAGASAVGADGLLDLNRAGAEELETLPGIGPSRAAAIVDHREREGPFSVPGDLRAVPGIGEATFQSLAPLVVVR